MSEIALELCPFCGKEPLVHRVPSMGRCYRVTCKFCDAGPHSALSEADAITAWNTRATPSQRLDPATVERIREIAATAYAEGASEVHAYWRECRPDVVFDRDPDFSEAAADYGRCIAEDLTNLATEPHQHGGKGA